MDPLCDALFLSANARGSDDNLLFVRGWLLRSQANAAALLDLYAQVWSGRRVPPDDTSPLMDALRLSGLVRIVGDAMQVRNRIYEHVFDREWLAAHAAPQALFASNLPPQFTRFIGREREIAEVQQLLGHAIGHRLSAAGEDRPVSPGSRRPTVDGPRLLTLTGIGGCGKTRLALEVVTRLRDAFPHGVWLVELASLAEPALVPQSVAAALGVREEPGRPLLQTLLEWLKSKKLLLLLDNCEHLVTGAAPLAAALMRECAGVQILATSREGLNVAGERAYAVPPLAAPDPRHLPATPAGLRQYEAVQLFLDRATAAMPAFALTSQNAPVVAQLCARLDGIPLAIELAASRLKALPLETLNNRLDDMLGLLTGGHRTALPRHQTLRALVDWSYDLLTEPEQVLLQRLSVFAGGCTLPAAEAVCSGVRAFRHSGIQDQPAAEPERLNARTPELPDPVLDLLTRLVEKSLVVFEEREGEGRYRLLEMIREYARERLVASGETNALRERHARFFLALAETAESELAQADQGFWLDRLEREHDNIRSVLAWSIGEGATHPPAEKARNEEPSPIEIGLRLASALQEFWIPRGHAKEGRAQLQRLLAHPDAAASTAARARGLSAAGALTVFGGELEAARTLYEESLGIWRRLEDRAGIALVLCLLGRLAVDLWDWSTARALVEESLVLWRELDDPAGIANALSLLAEVCRQEGDPAAARGLIEENLAIWRELGDRGRLMGGLDTLAMAVMEQGDMDAARRAIEESLAVARELGHKPGIAGALARLGHMAGWQEDWPAARAFYEQSLPLWRELDHKQGLFDTIGYLGLALREQGDSAAPYSLYEELLTLAREENWSIYIARSLASLGTAAADLGRWEEAAARCSESLRLSRSGEYEDIFHIAWALTALARAALARAQPAWAARLLGAAEPLWARSSHPVARRELERAASAVRAQMESAEFEAAWAEGQATPLEQTIAEALERV